MKKQVVVIHGGSAYDTYKEYIAALKKDTVDEATLWKLRTRRWKETLGQKLGKDFEVIAPSMPNSDNSRYLEWKIWFDKFIPHMHKGVVFVGHSLGGIFLAKYFAENADIKKSAGVFLVAAPFTNTNKEKMADFILPKDLSGLNKFGSRLHLYQSQDDPLVSYADVKKYAAALPEAQVTIFKNRGHFSQEKFPEIVKDIRALYK